MVSMSAHNQYSHTKLCTIMLVEDDSRARKAVCTLLSGIGHHVTAFECAEAAAETLPFFKPDIAILDVRLPGMFGNTLAALIRQQSPQTHIIFLTAEKEFDCELSDFVVLPKPLDPPRLIDQLYK